MSYQDYRINKTMNASGSNPSNSTTRSIHYGLVTDLLDNHRVRVRIQGLDTKISNNKLPICYSLLPMHIHLLPKVGEVVRVLLTDTSKPYEERLWIGPVITHYEYLNGQSYAYGNEVTLTEEAIAELTAPVPRDGYVDSKGVFPGIIPEPNEQKLLGRGNTEINIGLDSIQLKSGKHVKDNVNKLNTVNPAIIETRISSNGEGSSAIILADTILFASNQGSPLPNELTNQNISSDTISNFSKNAHPVPFGDKVKELFEIFRDYALEHAHPYDGKPPIKGDALRRLIDFDINSINSDYIKIN